MHAVVSVQVVTKLSQTLRARGVVRRVVLALFAAKNVVVRLLVLISAKSVEISVMQGVIAVTTNF